MTTHLINGKQIARDITAKLQARLKETNERPGLAIVLVGNDPASELYVRVKERACRELNINFFLHRFHPNIFETDVLSLIERLNKDQAVHGIVVQLPLPRHLNEDRVISAIDWRKDVDGFHPTNVANFLAGHPIEPPSLIRTIIALVKSTRVAMRGKRVAILANADVFVKPLAYEFTKRGAIPTIVKTGEEYRPTIHEADFIVTAYGQPEFIHGRDLKNGVVLIDVGITRLPEGRVVGDVDQASVQGIASWLTPVPGGVGPVTVAMLLERTVEAFEEQSAAARI